MLPAYIFIVDVIATNPHFDEQTVRLRTETVEHALTSLGGALGRSSCTLTLYPPDPQKSGVEQDCWSCRATVVFSLGKQRAEHLYHVCMAIARLIQLELPDFVVQECFQRWDFE